MKKIICFILLLLTMSFSFGSCQQEDETQANIYGENLVLKSFSNLNELSKQEQLILFRAFSRLDFVQTKDGFYKLKQKNGKEVNISENIYQYFRKIIAKTNTKMEASAIQYTRLGVWDTDSTAAGEDEYSTNNDCVIFVIQSLLNEFGDFTTTLEDIRTQLTRLGYYSPDKGTYGSCVQSALSCYFNVIPISNIDNFIKGPENTDKYCAIGRYSLGNNQYDYHAGVVNWSYNGTITYSDTQWNDTIGDYEPSDGVFLQGDVLMLYKLTLR